MRPLPFDLPHIVSYMGTPTHRLGSPLNSPYFIMENVSSISVATHTSSVHRASLTI